MKLFVTFVTVVLVLVGSVAAEVAETYEIEAGRAGGVASKVAIDLTAHGLSQPGVWLATGHGANYSFDDGDSWYVNNIATGLPSENLSAVFSIGDRIWIATNHNEQIQGELMTLSDGLSYSDDFGNNWTTLDFSSSGLNIPYVEGGDRTIFDITGHTDIGFFNSRPTDNDAGWLFFAAFAGGLVASQDGGANWRRIYASTNDSIQFNLNNQAPSLRNRYFACAVDTSHGDSLFLWGGTASGVFQYVFAPPRDKLYSHRIDGFSRSEVWTSGEGARFFMAGSNGLSLASTTGGQMATRFEVDGLTGPGVSAIFAIGDHVLAGGVNAAGDQSTGIAISSDGGETFSAATGPWTLGVERTFVDFAEKDGLAYAAMEQAGLFVSDDSGRFWQAVPLDTLYTEPRLSQVYSLCALSDTLWVGTDSGLVTLTLTSGGDIAQAVHTPFAESDSSSSRIIRIKPQTFETDTLPGYDSLVLWTVHKPATVSGTPVVGRRAVNGEWAYLRREVNVYDVNFFGDTVFAVGDNAIWFSPRGQEMTNFFSARQYVNDTLVVASLDQDTVTSMEVWGDTVVFGTYNGLAISQDRGESFRIYRANTDTLAADLVINHSYLSSFFGLAGDFVPAVGVQYQPSGPARIWAGCRPADWGATGISVAAFDDSTGAIEWNVVYEDDFAWNFEFLGDTVFAASNRGLLMNDGTLDSLSTVWETVNLGLQDDGRPLIEPGTEVYGVGLVDPFLWVGTDDGTVRLDRDNLGNQQLFVRVDSTSTADEVYAFPVPFSPNLGQAVDFHYTIEAAGNVTLEVYDFAMNLVARPIDNVYHAVGIYPAQGVQGYTWDGYNGQGDLVAVGIYYFKVELPSGDTRWGKIAVIP